MRGYLSTLRVIAQIAFRNLVASRLKTAIVGGIILFGAFLVVVGTSFLDSIVLGMTRSVTGSVAGQIQVYSTKSKDKLEVIGGFDFDGGDIAPIDDYIKLRQTLLAVDGVKAVVPMGISGAMVTSGNTIDLALAQLRDLARKKVAGRASAQDLVAYEAQKGHMRQILSVLQNDLKNIRQIQDERALSAEDAAAVARAASPEFWDRFDRDPLDALEFLENRIAPQATDADILFLRYVGTDPAAFAQSFDRMKIVDGTPIPRGKRGFLFAKFTYEEQVKLKTARRLDKIKLGRDERGARISKEPELQRFVKENSTQVREILLQLDGPKTDDFQKKLQAQLHSAETDVARLLSQFLRTDDTNFDARYRFFYDQLAPALQLYRVRIGDTLTIKAFTRSGYVQSVSLPVYGTFNFTGLEKSPQAGSLNMMDLVSFRELYGFLTAEREKEIRELKATMNAREISRENAEVELFGTATEANGAPAAAPLPAAPFKPTGRTVTADATPGLRVPVSGGLSDGLAGKFVREDLTKRVYDPHQLESGVVLNAAVILKDPTRIRQTITAIEEAGRHAGLPLKAVSWQEASGLIGQFVSMMRAVLLVAVLIIFVVALVIINNALVMATLERVREIGTLRAIGAQRRFILAMLVIEAIVIGIIFGAIGAGLGALLVTVVGRVGIPAPSEIVYFFFSGPRLHPTLASTNLVVSLAIVLLVSALSGFYPAWLAMRVTPRQAMQSED
jgi:ABC-type lipoprotein release transport system permease subunit